VEKADFLINPPYYHAGTHVALHRVHARAATDGMVLVKDVEKLTRRKSGKRKHD
jgi:hypothetical protein